MNRFNKIGNREMYMNCAVVDIEGGNDYKKIKARDGKYVADEADISASAQLALSGLPDLYVANLAGINDCKTQETRDANFDSPGDDVEYGDSSKPARLSVRAGKGKCTGAGHQSAIDTSPISQSTPNNPTSDNDHSQQVASCNDGQWYPDGCGNTKHDNGVSSELPFSEGIESVTENTKTSSSGEDKEETVDQEEAVEDEGENEDVESLDQDEDVSESSAKKPSAYNHKAQKPKYYYDNYDYRHSGEEYDPEANYGDYGVYRQFKTRDLREEETATSLPDPGIEAFFNDDEDIIPGFEVVSDESTTIMVIQEPSTRLTIQAPTASAQPLYDSEGYFVVGPPAGDVNPGAFIIPISSKVPPIAALPSSSSEESANAPLEGLGGLKGFTWPSPTRSQTSYPDSLPIETSLISTSSATETTPAVLAAVSAPVDPLLEPTPSVAVDQDLSTLLDELEDPAIQPSPESSSVPAVLVASEAISSELPSTSSAPTSTPSEVPTQSELALGNLIGEPPVAPAAVTEGEPAISESNQILEPALLQSDDPTVTSTSGNSLPWLDGISQFIPGPPGPAEVSNVDLIETLDLDVSSNARLCAKPETVTKYIQAQPTAPSSARIRRRSRVPHSDIERMESRLMNSQAQLHSRKRQVDEDEESTEYFDFDDLEGGDVDVDIDPEEFFGPDEIPWVDIVEVDETPEIIYTFSGGEKLKKAKRQYEDEEEDPTEFVSEEYSGAGGDGVDEDVDPEEFFDFNEFTPEDAEEPVEITELISGADGEKLKKSKRSTLR